MNDEQAIDRVMRLMAIPGKSGEEQRVSEAIIAELQAAGASASDIRYDDANTRTRIAGQVGNLIFHLAGDPGLPTRMFSAHMDTVPICEHSQPVRDGGLVYSADANTGLGADNRAGCAAILTAAIEALQLANRSHPPLVFTWFVQEEVGLQGAKNLDQDLLGPVALAFNFDGGTVEKLTVGATGGERMIIKVFGRAAHAGVAPEQGVNAITIASLAIHRLHAEGWLGRVEKPEGSGTSNIGVISGGQATNVVTPEVTIHAEARSHQPAMRSRIVAEIRSAFQWAAEQVRSTSDLAGSVTFTSNVDYDSFRLSDDDPSVSAASDAVLAIGRTPFTDVAGGGLDANWLYTHGIQAVSLGCGQRNIHTADEQLDLKDFLDACQIAIRLATATQRD